MSISKELRLLVSRTILVLIVMISPEISAQSEVKSVKIQVGEQDPTGCRLLGRVKGSSKDNQMNEEDVPYIDRLITARHNLTNETRKLGGNTVHIIRANNSGKYEIPGADEEIIFIGDAYYCE